MLTDVFDLVITGGYSRVFEYYPSKEEIIEFINEVYPDGVGYYQVGVLKQTNPPTYQIEATITKRMVYYHDKS